ncbi:hypothetical protein ANCCEY_01880 [Ancylostoma ceylanicum]|uniref:G-protein coupled receptors family 1 profile domain-containing protein n=1 Tax=Ancylostoma ceylanicum TaxID=53326 RepID=A0A0D6M6B1_9BILA|nr:hypothetical protein ANCCEY_01880 [Ancylostoma ceylanicum]
MQEQCNWQSMCNDVPEQVLPILLCVSDTTNCLAILILGAESVGIYNRAIRDNIVPVETSLSCALSAPVYLRIAGSVMSPLVHTAIAFDRFVCVKFPMWYRSAIAKRQYILPLLVTVAVFIFLPIGFYLAYLRRHDTVKFYCGRRASFGQVYSMMIYTLLVFGYFLAFLANMFTFVMIRISNRQNKSFVQTLKIATTVSFVSFLLISIPNTSSFVDTLIRISPLALQLTTYLSVIAYSLTFFLYIALNPDFRQRTLHRLTCGYAKVANVMRRLFHGFRIGKESIHKTITNSSDTSR